jgi:tetratricopeptide (TPR) repeat protein
MARESFLTLVASAIIEVLHGKELEVPQFDLLGPLAYTAMVKDASALQAQYMYLKEHRSDVYEFNVQQLSTIGNLVIQLFNDSAKAEALFQLNLEEYPNEVLAYKDLGKLYLRDGNHEKALRKLQEALPLSKDDEELKKLLEDAEKSVE